MLKSAISNIIFFSPILFLWGISIFLIYIYDKNHRNLIYFSALNHDEIVSRMALQNIKDNIKFKCIQDEIEINKFKLVCTDIYDDLHYKPGYVVYKMYLEPKESGTVIYLYLIERSSFIAQLQYSDVMTKFMKNKLQAQLHQSGLKD